MRFLVLLALLPLPALAEGARQTFDCEATVACDGGGTCVPSHEATLFTLDPVAVESHGGGAFSVSYGGSSFDATLLPYLPVVTWTDSASLIHVLTGIAEPSPGTAQMLWQRLDLPDGAPSITFLTCGVTQ